MEANTSTDADRRYDIYKRTKRGSSNESAKKLFYVQQEKPSKAEKGPPVNQSFSRILNQKPMSPPPPKPILRNSLVRSQRNTSSRSIRSPRDIQIHNSYPGGVRVIRFGQDRAKPVLVYRPGPPRPTYTQPHHPNTVPHLRLGDYRPKVVSGYFSPNNVRSLMDEFPAANTDSSFNSSGSKFAWIPAEPEKVSFLQLDEKSTQTKPAKERRKVTRNSATSTSNHKIPERPPVKTIKQDSTPTPQITQYIESGSKFVIIDYIDTDGQRPGELPLSTSTPRDYHGHVTDSQGHVTDSNHNLVTRQRKPHDGSLRNIPVAL